MAPREWIGIDITQLAISLIKNRLQDTYGNCLKCVNGMESSANKGTWSTDTKLAYDAHSSYDTSIIRIIGKPVTSVDAEKLTENDKFQFQWWTLGLVGACPR